MSGTADPNPLESVVTQLTERLDQLGTEMGALRRAFTEAEDERQQAPTEPSIEAQAKAAGLSVGAYREALKQGRKAQFIEDYGDVIRELAATPAPAAPPAAGDPPAGPGGPPDPPADPPADPPKPPEDTSPDGGGHWSNQPVAKLLGLRG